jgi:predicted TIM-barrel fold metal-dependent hydrolase
VAQRPIVISADSHVNIPETAFAEYFPAHLKERAPRVERGADKDTVVFEGTRSDISLIAAVAGRPYEEYQRFATRLGEGAVGGYDPVERLKDMDVDGVDAEVLYGTVGGGFLNQTDDPELKLALVRAYNDWLADYCRAAPERLIGLAEMPYWDLAQTLAETKRARDRGLRGIILPGVPWDHNYTEAHWEPLWDLVEDLDLPVHWHLGAKPITPRLAENMMIFNACQKSMLSEPIASVIYGSVLQRHPKLQVVSVEGGIGWAAFLVPWMDNVFRRHRHWQHSPLTEEPSAYFQRQVKLTFMEDAVGVRERHTIGLDCLMWASDYPHADSTWPHSQATIAEDFAGVPEAEVAQIVGSNAARLYGIEAPVTVS